MGFTSTSELAIILAAVDANMDGFLDYYEIEKLREICKDALREFHSGISPYRPWVKQYKVRGLTSLNSIRLQNQENERQRGCRRCLSRFSQHRESSGRHFEMASQESPTSAGGTDETKADRVRS